MKTITSGSAWNFNIELDPPADLNSVSWALRGNDGTPLSGYTDVTMTNLDQVNRISIPVPGAANTKTLGAGLTENRFLTVSWTAGGASNQTGFGYLLADFMPILVTENEIRAACALTQAELADDEIDIGGAARVVSSDIGSTVFTTALTTGDHTTTLVNLMIAYRAVLNLGPAIQLRIMQAQSEAETKLQRLTNLSVKDLVTQLRNQYDLLRSSLTGFVDPAPTLFTTTKRPPPIRYDALYFPANPILPDRYFPWIIPCPGYVTF